MNIVPYIGILVYIGLFFLSIWILHKIFGFKIFVDLINHPRREFSKSAGFISFAAFLLAIFIPLLINYHIIFEKLLNFFLSGNFVANENLNVKPIHFIILAFSWLGFNFIILLIFESQKTK